MLGTGVGAGKDVPLTSIAYKATQARRKTQTTELEHLAPLRTTAKLNWNKTAPF